MDSTKVMSLLETLDDEIDDLEESLQPLLKSALSETASKLPLLDKAKLYVLVTYAIESMLFSYLRLNGIKAREHPVFKELTRVKQYFDKIKAIETPVERNMAVDKAAAARFIKAGLSGNDKYDLARAEQIAKERAKAHIKFGDSSKDGEKKRKAGELEAATEESSDSSDSDSSSGSAPEITAKPVGSKKKQKMDKTESRPTSGTSTPASASNDGEKKSEKSKRSGEENKTKKKKRSKRAKMRDKKQNGRGVASES
ncbi:Sas10/Utp3/C1D family-domain-containing protein [Leptodontidium sp. MPI-SDFR-AT-0119]|nr:Sas10/Utp3/C1D family-domain-containing protein [Leptodontidium sp. MPI-SDFR-AT-0119]